MPNKTVSTVELVIDGKNVNGIKAIEGTEAKLRSLENTANKSISSMHGSFKDLDLVLNGLGLSIGKLSFLGALGGLGVLLKESIDTADELNKLSQKVGVSVEALSTMRYAAELADVPLETLQSSLAKLNRNAYEAMTGTGQAAKAFFTLGINVTETNGKVKDTDKILLEIAKKFSTMPDGVEKSALAMQLLGRYGYEIIPFLNQGAEGISKLQQEARKLGQEISTDTAQKAEAFNDNVKALEVSFRGAANEIMTSLMPTLTGLGNFVKNDVAPIVVNVGESLSKWGKVFDYLGVQVNKFIDNPENQTFLTIIKALSLHSLFNGDFGVQKVQPKIKDTYFDPLQWKEVHVEVDQVNEALIRAWGGAIKISKEAPILASSMRPWKADLENINITTDAFFGKEKNIFNNYVEIVKQASKLSSHVSATHQDASKLDGDFQKLKQTLVNDVILQGLDPQTRKLYDIIVQVENLEKAYEGIPNKQKIISDYFDEWINTTEFIDKVSIFNLSKRVDVLSTKFGEIPGHLLLTKKLMDLIGASINMLPKFPEPLPGKDQNEQPKPATGPLKPVHVDGIEEAYASIREGASSVTADAMLDFLLMEGTLSQVFGNMASAADMFYQALGEKQSVAFEMYKAFSIAETIATTYQSAVKAYEAMVGIPFVGPALAVAAAASAITFGLAKVALIRQLTPGASGAAGGGGGTGVYATPQIPSSVSNYNSNTTNNNNSKGPTHITINFQGGYPDEAWWRKNAPYLKRLFQDGLIDFKPS